MRILNLFTQSDIGGAERVILNLIRFRQNPSIQHLAVIFANQPGPLACELAELGIDIHYLPRGRMRNPLSLLSASRHLRHLLRTLRPDCILANSSQGFLYARYASFRLKIPLAVYFMLVPQPALLANHPFEILMALHHPQLIFTASNKNARILQNWGLSHVHPVHHGTPHIPPTPPQQQEVQSLLQSLAISPSDPLILFPGRLQPWKGQLIFIDAFAQIAPHFPHAHAAILGGALFGMDQNYPALLASRIAELNLSHRIHLLGHQPLAPWLARANLVVHASLQPDPFPLVCLEALAAQRPLITNSLSGTCEILQDRQNALIVPPSDPAALAHAIFTLLATPVLAQSLAHAGHQLYLHHSTPPHMVDPIEQHLLTLAPTSSPNPHLASQPSHLTN